MTSALASTEIVELLTHRVRIFTLPQIAAACRATRADAEALVGELVSDGLVERRSVLARPVLPLTAPVVRWTPGGEPPDFGKAAYRLKSRWTAPVQPTEIAIAAKRAKKLLGGCLGGRWPRTSEVTHDIHVAELFFWHIRQGFFEAAEWVPEARLYAEGRGRGGRLPDAVMRRGGVEVRIIEFGGSYGKAKLADFHREMNRMPYEIW